MYYIKCNYAWNNQAVVGKIYEVEDLNTNSGFSCYTWAKLLEKQYPVNKNAFEIVLLEEEIY